MNIHYKFLKNLLVSISLILIFSACTSAPRKHHVPESMVEKVEISGFPDIRFWGDELPERLETLFLKIKYQIDINKQEENIIPPKSIEYLAISGGGADGAFGAGFLTGWTETEKRPLSFKVVTGVSTGAIIAPFAFLGSKYDNILKELYTLSSGKKLIKGPNLFEIFKAEALVSSKPLKDLISQYININIIKEIANEYRKGRRLYIGTTNLDAGRPVIWDIGAIAASENPQALNLIHNIILASSAIPGIFPPVYFNVNFQNQLYNEIHVDGGISSQVFLYPTSLNGKDLLKKIDYKGSVSLYIIRNAFTKAPWIPVKSKISDIARLSINTLILHQGVGDIYRLYFNSIKDNLDFNLISIPEDFKIKKPLQEFNKEYMNNLFNFGYNFAKEGPNWQKTPPGFNK